MPTTLTPSSFHRLIQQCAAGDQDALGDLVTGTYDELRRLAQRLQGSGRQPISLTPTELVHELWLRKLTRLVRQLAQPAERSNFFRYVGSAMLDLLRDHRRRRRAPKGDGRPHPLDGVDAPGLAPEQPEDVEALALALEELRAAYPDWWEVVCCKYLQGDDCSDSEAAQRLGLNNPTVRYRRTAGVAFVRSRLAARRVSP